MPDRRARTETLRHLSAIGTGVLLAATPHCGGKSEGPSNDSGAGRGERGGASGSAGTDTGGSSYGGQGFGGVGQGAYGGAYAGSYAGAYGGSYGGAVGIGGCPSYIETRCYTPAELAGCFPPDAGTDTGTGGSDGTGEGGFGGQASEAEPERSAPADAGLIIREASVAPPPINCPSEAPFPECVVSENPPPRAPLSLVGWNGSACCYTFANQCN